MLTTIPTDQNLDAILEVVGERFPEVDIDSIRTSLAVLDFASTVSAATEVHFSRYGLSQGRFALLMILYTLKDREWPPAKLADAVGSTRATVSGLLDGLESGGWIERCRNPRDGRSCLVKLTPGGRQRMTDILPDHLARKIALFSVLSEDERDVLVTLLSKLASAYRAAQADP